MLRIISGKEVKYISLTIFEYYPKVYIIFAIVEKLRTSFSIR